jgi:hypothetical protein
MPEDNKKRGGVLLMNIPWIKRRKIATLPNIKTDPKLVLHRVLEKVEAGEVVSVYVSMEWSDNRGFDADWSNMQVGSLALHAMNAMAEAQKVSRGEE